MSIVIVLLEATSTVIVAFTMQRVPFEFQLMQYTNQTVLQMAVVRDQCLADDRIEVQKFESCPGQIRQFFVVKIERHVTTVVRDAPNIIFLLSYVSAHANIPIQQHTSSKRQTKKFPNPAYIR